MNYFTIDDDFNYIIEFFNPSKDIEINKCNHGKSSFVYYVKIDNKDYIYKFPRTCFQTKFFKKEEYITNLLNNYFSVRIPHIKILKYENKELIYYDLIDGNNMSDIALNDKEYEVLCYELANFLKELYTINVETFDFPLETKKDNIENFCKDFNYKPNFSIIEDIINDNSNVIHGDFHRSNIIVDNNKHLNGILDFSTLSIGSVYFDLGHMCFSMNEQFNKLFLNICEKVLGIKIDMDKINRTIHFLDEMINKNYLPYIRSKNHV